jgi:hypothetical protein
MRPELELQTGLPGGGLAYAKRKPPDSVGRLHPQDKSKASYSLRLAPAAA